MDERAPQAPAAGLSNSKAIFRKAARIYSSKNADKWKIATIDAALTFFSQNEKCYSIMAVAFEFNRRGFLKSNQ
jgi:hypothetical protein